MEMFRIGEFSKLGRTTIKTLRYYDTAGLLKPVKTDRVTGYRYYESSQLLTLHLIQSLRHAGVSVRGISEILAGKDPREALSERKKALEAECAEISRQISCIEGFLLQEGDSMMKYSATIKEIPEYIVFSKKLFLPDQSALFTEIPKIGETLARVNPGLKCVQPDYCYLLELDAEHREHDIHVEYCQAVETAGIETDGIVFKTVPKATVVSVLHRGPYENLPEAFAFAFAMVDEQKYEVCGIPRISYIDGVWNRDSPKDWLTEIQIPVKGAGL